MRAIEIQQTGGPEVLRPSELPLPRLADGEVLIRNAYAGVNYIDIYHREGLYPLPLPAILGLEGCGIVEQTRGNVHGLGPGDRVAYANIAGAYAEHIAAPADRLVVVPESIDARIAAAVMLQGLTAQALTQSVARLRAGMVVLVHAAAGGVGQLLVQFARSLGVTVIGTVSTAEKADIAKKAGASHVINYSCEDFVAASRNITGGIGVDVVFDSVGKATFQDSLLALRRRGLMVAYGNASGPPDPVDPAQLMRLGSLVLTRPILYDFIANREELVARSDKLFAAIMAGKLTVRIADTFSLADAAKAHRLLQSRASTGKLLLNMGEAR